MNYVVEDAYQSMSRYGEELCGDHVEVTKAADGTIFVLSDGLGHGVKANILSTLTSKVAIGLLKKNLPLEEIIGTIVQTLPVCQMRNMGYSTLAILKVFNDGSARLIEMDTPAAFLLRQGNVLPLEMNERLIHGKWIREAEFVLEKGDCVFLASDGVIHAGIGGLMDFGLGWEGVAGHLAELDPEKLSVAEIVDKLMKICQAYYLMEPGDDFTLIGAKLRDPRRLTIMTGPPMNPADDSLMARRFARTRGRKVICGGTTAQIFSRELNRELFCTFDYIDPDIPPVSRIEGVDLVTEGLLTLNKTCQYLRDYRYPDRPTADDGASLLTRELLMADEITLLVGGAVNEAHQNLNLPVDLGIRTQVMERFVASLEGLHKKVNLVWY